MDFGIYWTFRARENLDLIYDYYSKKANFRVAKKLVQGIINATKPLSQNPFIGQVEGMLNNREKSYRYLVFYHYKIIYWPDEQNKQIRIADVFDTRQTPDKIKKAKE